MLVIRDIMYCKPGKVRALVEKFHAMNKLGKKLGFPATRIMTDVSAERYWTLAADTEVESLEKMEKMYSGEGQSEEDMKEFAKIMEGYHDLIDYGRREIYKLEE